MNCIWARICFKFEFFPTSNTKLLTYSTNHLSERHTLLSPYLCVAESVDFLRSISVYRMSGQEGHRYGCTIT